MAFYVICDDDSKHEGMTKEQILAAITQAIETGSIGNCDTGFITKIKEQNRGGYITVWAGTQAQYNAIAEKALNCLYIITDDTASADTKAAFDAARKAAEDAAAAAGGAASKAVSLLMPVDITDKLTFALGDYNPAGIKSLSVNAAETKFSYNPATKTVFFNLRFSVQGGVSAGDVFSIKLGGNYLPSNQSLQFMSYALTSNSAKCKVMLSTMGDAVMFTALEAMDPFECSMVTGWYFCEGEGD